MKTKYLDLPTLIFYLFVQSLRQERTKGGFTGLAKEYLTMQKPLDLFHVFIGQ